MAFKKLFQTTNKNNDGLTQSAREAIVDALHFCMYADRHIAVREDEFIETAARTLDWDTNISYEYYEGKSTGAVSAALSHEETRQAFFASLRERLPGRMERELTLQLAEGLTRSDGSQTEEEAAAVQELRKVLFA